MEKADGLAHKVYVTEAAAEAQLKESTIRYALVWFHSSYDYLIGVRCGLVLYN